jgi:hypothetical protein
MGHPAADTTEVKISRHNNNLDAERRRVARPFDDHI